MTDQEPYQATLQSAHKYQVADLIAGLIDGFTGHDNKEYIRSCYNTEWLLEAALNEALKDFSSFNIENFIKGGKAIFNQSESILRVVDTCPDYRDEMQ